MHLSLKRWEPGLPNWCSSIHAEMLTWSKIKLEMMISLSFFDQKCLQSGIKTVLSDVSVEVTSAISLERTVFHFGIHRRERCWCQSFVISLL